MRDVLVVVCLCLVAGTAAPGAAQRGSAAASADVPVSMTCPMHPDVVEPKPGSCPICKMSLVPVRLATIWTCPIHSVIAEDNPGKCPIDRRDLIQMTVALTWTCSDRPDVNQIDRGTCPDGKPMIAKRTLRPHGNHNPQHGGQFFMAPDTFHHLEGAYPRERVFRLYLYDDYARPLPDRQIQLIKGRVVTKETFDSATRTTKETAAFPLVVSRNGPYLEARIEATVPAQVAAKIRFKDDAPEYRFDFTFPALTEDRSAPAISAPRVARGSKPPVAVGGRGPNPPAASSAAAAPTPSASGPAADAVPAYDPTASTPIPSTVAEMLVQLKSRNEQIGELVQRGDFGAVWVPAFQAKDLAVALETHVGELEQAKRETAAPAINRLVRTAWLLDAFGDLGNRQQIVEAYAIFNSTVGDVVAIFGNR